MITLRLGHWKTHCQFCGQRAEAVGALIVSEEGKTSICDECLVVVSAKARETALAHAQEEGHRVSEMVADIPEHNRVSALTNEQLVIEAAHSIDYDKPSWIVLTEALYRLYPNWMDKTPADSTKPTG